MGSHIDNDVAKQVLKKRFINLMRENDYVLKKNI